jgi:small GTP-binding protein
MNIEKRLKNMAIDQHLRASVMLLGSQPTDSKVVILGSTTVGKTSLVSRLTTDSFSPNTTPTVGTTFLGHTVKVGENEVKLQLWDTGGSEKYRSMVPMYFQHADAAILVYDITSRESFTDTGYWLKELREKGPKQVVIALAGNKLDLEQMRAVSKEMGQKFAEENHIPVFLETSAVTDENIKKIFQAIAKEILDRNSIAPSGPIVGLTPRRAEEDSPCC